MTDANYTRETFTSQDEVIGNPLMEFIQETAALPQAGQTRFTRSVPFSRMRKTPPAVNWLVEDLFQRGDLYMLYGKPGSKKTWAALDLGVCVAMGIPWMGMTTRQGNVLIIDEESGDDRLHRRMYALLNGHFVPEETDLPITAYSMNRPNFGEPDWCNDLSLLIQQHQASLVIIDTLVNVSLGIDENDAKKIQPVLRNIRDVAQHTKSTIILLHHTNKNGDYRGSTAIEGEVDMWVELVSERGSDFMTFNTGKERDNGHSEFYARIDFVKKEIDGVRHLYQVNLYPTDKMAENKLTPKQIELLLWWGDQADYTADMETIRINNGAVKDGTAKNIVSDFSSMRMQLAVRVGDGGKNPTYKLTAKGIEEYEKLAKRLLQS